MTNLEVELKEIFTRRGIKPSEKLGQNFLVDESALDVLAGEVLPGANVIEVGSGTGTLTKKLAQRAGKVIGIEIDGRFTDVLNQQLSGSPNAEIIFADALSINFDSLISSDRGAQWQIIANLPFHISEPFLKKIIGLPIENAVLVVGDKLASVLQIDNPKNWSYSRLSMLGDTFFYINTQTRLPKFASYPPPRTDLSIVSLTPREEQDFRTNPRLAVQRRLFSTENEHLAVQKVIKEVLDGYEEDGSSTLSKRERNRIGRRKNRQELRDYMFRSATSDEISESEGRVENLGLPQNILSTPFFRLDNSAIRSVAEALIGRFG